MSSLEMLVLGPKFSYQRLKSEGGYDANPENGSEERPPRRRAIRSRYRLRSGKRFKVKIPGLRRFLRRRARLVMGSWSKVVRRLKESKSHLGDLFAGNYLFMQVTPTPLAKTLEKKYKSQIGGEVCGMPSNYPLGSGRLYHY